MGLARSTYYDEPEIQPIDEARRSHQAERRSDTARLEAADNRG
jgi:hypothetical protein